MAGTGTIAGRLEYLFRATHTSTGDLASGGAKLEIGRTVVSPTDGTGTGEVNRAFADVQTAQTAATDVDFYDFAGETDELGRTYALTKLKLVVVKNTHASNDLVISPIDGNGNFTGLLGANLTLAPGGVWVIYNPAGVIVTDATDHILQIASTLPGTTPCSFEVLAMGSQ